MLCGRWTVGTFVVSKGATLPMFGSTYCETSVREQEMIMIKKAERIRENFFIFCFFGPHHLGPPLPV